MKKGNSMTTRLNNSMRKTILNKALEHKFRNYKGTFQARIDLIEKIYDSLYTEKEMSLLKSLPVDWINDIDRLYVKFGGSDYAIWFNGSYYQNKTRITMEINRCLPDKKKPVTANFASYGALKYNARHEFSLTYVDITREEENHRSEYDEAQVMLDKVLNSVTTVAALLKNYPEMAPFVDSLEAKIANLPAIPREKINELFELPVEEMA